MATTARQPRCSRGELLREYREECRRAARFVGNARDGAGQRLLAEARGRLFKRLAAKWRPRTLLPHIAAITAVLNRVEQREVGNG